MKTTTRILAIVLLLLSAIGCEPRTAPPPPPTYTVTISGVHGTQTFTGAKSVDISMSEQVTIQWYTSNATVVPHARLDSMFIEGDEPVELTPEKPIQPGTATPDPEEERHEDAPAR